MNSELKTIIDALSHLSKGKPEYKEFLIRAIHAGQTYDELNNYVRPLATPKSPEWVACIRKMIAAAKTCSEIKDLVERYASSNENIKMEGLRRQIELCK